MSERLFYEPSIAKAGIGRSAEVTRGGTVPVAGPRSAFDRESNRRASGKATAAESQHTPAPPELHKKSPAIAKTLAFGRGTGIPNDLVRDVP
jgi:hypothetical protein